MKKIIKWSVIIVISLLVIWVLNSYRKCRKKGKESGKKLFECSPFSSEPEFLNPEEVRYKMREGKCYEITDYGRRMSFRQVGLSQCGENEMEQEAVIEEEIK